jgi:pimeloyl-ACP methyl ester carboxylesterase
LPCMRFNIEPLRYRHKPIIFYAVTHGVFHILQRGESTMRILFFCVIADPYFTQPCFLNIWETVLKNHHFEYVRAKDSKKNLSYWYRKRSKDTSRSKAPLVFVHGCGGMAFYYNLIRDLVHSVNDDDVPIILLELPHISLRICDHIPDIHDQINSLCTIMDNVSGKLSKATFVGHSFGSIVLSWMIQSRPERVGSCVFIGRFPNTNICSSYNDPQLMICSARSNMLSATFEQCFVQFPYATSRSALTRREEMGKPFLHWSIDKFSRNRSENTFSSFIHELFIDHI